jgi:carbonic anhydrase
MNNNNTIKSKMKNISLFSIFQCCILCFLSYVVYAQEKVIWDYPLKSGMKEWATLRTKKQMVDACQIPLNVLNNTNTKDLVTICLNYPMFNDYLLYDDERKGIFLMIIRINGLRELSQREDRTTELIQAYSDFPILTQIQKDPASKEYHNPYKLPFLEMLLCDTLFLNKMNNVELEELKTIALDKYTSKLQNPDIYSLAFNVKKTMLLIASIMLRQDDAILSPEQQNTLKTFIENYNHCPHNLLTEVSKIISS